MKILLEDSPIALWKKVVHDAETACTVNLKQEIEAYLVFLLSRYTTRPDFVNHIIANEFLNGLHITQHHQRQASLQEVGDKCLLFSGLFPHIAEKRQVKISYFVNIGQSAYESISYKSSDLYGTLAREFVQLMDVLQSIRCYAEAMTDLLPLEAYELWNEVGSQRALKALGNYTKGVPILINSEKNRQ